MDIVLVIPEDSIILDLGTGHGLVLIKFASKISSEGHVTGIDLWKIGINPIIVLKHTTAFTGKNLENRSDLKTADMIELPFENKKYDFVTASMAIHNIKPKQNRYKALDEATRVLKTEGLLIY
ncbi:class I SAM-dependent methyltransferase [Lactococcus lactis]|uniref:class I SAM-dependent methyltransferase n=1 Tax=Lactococcus lactis TaxID=1358 RepID=UPI001CDB881B|nr:class I SAM-dependent methyltransferase [Lactococcus lactis]UBU72155.1 class I SAM-dependent methyltransferase [Lactococcus lactis]